MNERNAIEAREAIDKDRWACRQSVMSVLSVLRDFIPRSCIREAEDRLFDAFFINGTELTSITMRKEYEQWKKLQLDVMMFQPTATTSPPIASTQPPSPAPKSNGSS